MALSADRETPKRDAAEYEYPIAASAECFAGGIAVLDASGNCKPGTAAASLIAVGRINEYVIETTGVAATKNVKVLSGTFQWKNSASNPASKANIGDTLYIEDDETVTTDGTGTSAVGTMVDIDDYGVWVACGPDKAAKVSGTVGVDFNDCRVHDNLAALLPVAGATDDLGNVPGTVGTTAPSLQTEDLKAAGATDNKATFFLKVPDWYLPGSTLTLVCNAGMITTVADTTATLDVECWVPDYANADGTVSSDLCTTAAQSINSTTFADKSFTIDDDVAGHAIAPGDILQFRITTAVNDGATGTAVIAAIRKIHLAVSA